MKGYKLWWKISYNNMVGQKIIKGNSIEIAGSKYKFFKRREIEGTIMLLTFKRDTCGDYFVYLVCETAESECKVRLGKSIGFDFGFKGKMFVAEYLEDDISPWIFSKSRRIL